MDTARPRKGGTFNLWEQFEKLKISSWHCVMVVAGCHQADGGACCVSASLDRGVHTGVLTAPEERCERVLTVPETGVSAAVR